MADNKTKETNASVGVFLNTVADPQKRADCKAIAAMMRRVTGKRAKMWGPSIVGFDRYDYRYDSGRSGSFMMTGFSPRAQNIVLYVMPGFSKFGELLERLGRHKTGKSCLYIRRLADVDKKVLERLVRDSVTHMRKKYGAR